MPRHSRRQPNFTLSQAEYEQLMQTMAITAEEEEMRRLNTKRRVVFLSPVQFDQVLVANDMERITSSDAPESPSDVQQLGKHLQPE